MKYKIIRNGIEVETQKIYYIDKTYNGEIVQIEFEDKNGRYRNWKKAFDGGYAVELQTNSI